MILASFTMGIHGLFLGLFFFLYLTGVRSEDDMKAHLIISNQIYTGQNHLDLMCQDACDETGDIIECMVRASGKCVSRYYLVCLRSQYGECKTINSSCPDGSGSVENMCEAVMNVRRDFGANTRKQSGRSMRSNTSGMRRLNNLYRRDLRSADDVLPRFSPNSAMVASSGNGHAIVIDDDRIAESHYGGPQIVSSLGSDTIAGMMNFPFSWMSQKMKSAYEPSVQPNPKKEQEYSQSQFSPYRSLGYGSLYGSDYGIYRYPSYYGNSAGTYTRPKPYSPFGSFFNNFGLQDPMLMLQYLPIAFPTSVRKNPFL